MHRVPVIVSMRVATAVEAAQLLADWRVELGYLQHADAVQMLTDAFGDRFVNPAASRHGCIRCDVLNALQALVSAPDWVNEVECWES